MYIIEFLIKKKKKKETVSEELEQEETECDHIFMPIDSTGEILSCRNCGMIVNRKDLKDINFFKHNDIT